MHEVYTLSTQTPNFAEKYDFGHSSEPTTFAAVPALEQSVFQATKQEETSRIAPLQ
jgi:hypothetical protein